MHVQTEDFETQKFSSQFLNVQAEDLKEQEFTASFREHAEACLVITKRSKPNLQESCHQGLLHPKGKGQHSTKASNTDSSLLLQNYPLRSSGKLQCVSSSSRQGENHQEKHRKQNSTNNSKHHQPKQHLNMPEAVMNWRDGPTKISQNPKGVNSSGNKTN